MGGDSDCADFHKMDGWILCFWLFFELSGSLCVCWVGFMYNGFRVWCFFAVGYFLLVSFLQSWRKLQSHAGDGVDEEAGGRRSGDKGQGCTRVRGVEGRRGESLGTDLPSQVAGGTPHKQHVNDGLVTAKKVNERRDSSTSSE